MQWPLGQSQAFKRQAERSSVDAKLLLIALHALALIPLALIYKRWAAEVSCGLVGLMFLIHSYRARDWRWVKSPPVLVGFALCAYLLFIVTPLAVDPIASLSRSIVWWRFILLFAAVVHWLSDYTEEMKRICVWMLIIICLATIDACIQYFSGMSLTGTLKPGHRLTGPMTKLVVGIYLAKLSFPILGLLLYEAWESNRRRQIWLYFILVTAMMAAITLSNERTALITYVMGLALTGGLMFWFLKSARKLVLLFAVLQIAILYLIYTTQGQFQSRVSDSMNQLGGFEASTYAQLWKASWEIWKDNPIVGVGLMNFRDVCPQLMAAGVVTYCDLHSHNLYFEWLAETGIVGFAGVLILLGSLIHVTAQRLRYARPQDYILISFGLAGLLPTFFPLAATQSFFSNWPALLAWFSIAMSVGMVQRIKPHAA